MTLTARFEDALVWAAQLHRDQTRKAKTVPYVSHLLAVCALVLDAGGDEDMAIAALLHDAIEDQGVTADEIASRFGTRVADIVVSCTDTDVHRKPALPQQRRAETWRARKEAWLARLASPATTDDAVLVVAADKLHNASALAADLRAIGPTIWSRFHAGADEQLSYYRAVADVVTRRRPGRLADALRAAVDELASAITEAG